MFVCSKGDIAVTFRVVDLEEEDDLLRVVRLRELRHGVDELRPGDAALPVLVDDLEHAAGKEVLWNRNNKVGKQSQSAETMYTVLVCTTHAPSVHHLLELVDAHDLVPVQEKLVEDLLQVRLLLRAEPAGIAGARTRTNKREEETYVLYVYYKARQGENATPFAPLPLRQTVERVHDPLHRDPPSPAVRIGQLEQPPSHALAVDDLMEGVGVDGYLYESGKVGKELKKQRGHTTLIRRCLTSLHISSLSESSISTRLSLASSLT